MKLPTLLVVFLAGAISTVPATAQSQPDTASQGSAQVSGNPETLQWFHLGTPVNSTSLISHWSQQNSYQFPVHILGFGKVTVCYKMRSYHMVREDQDSDVTRMDGYTTCQPASKYQTKSTVLIQH